uniref:RALGAPB_N domain-containing protein n=1 Tax=Macrostomum lignano TaxID=282301 RepID=A0A1I8JR06_9PLAT
AACMSPGESLRKRIYDRFRNTADRCWQRSVLHAYPPDVGRQVRLLHCKKSIETIRCLDTQQEVAWTMEAICYGLTLPFSRASPADTDETASCCYPRPSCRDEVTIPRMLKEDPNLYCRRMLAHLFNVFVPRRDLTGGGRSACSVWRVSTVSDVGASGGGGAVADDGLRYQLTVCKNVLLKCVEITEKSRIITPETWETILEFLLIVNDVILTEPRDSKEQSLALRQHSLEDSKRSKSSVNTFKEALAEDHWAEQCKRVIDVLMRTWLLACRNHFPRPPLWKTFRELLRGWRHHEEVAAKRGEALASQLVCSELGQETVRQGTGSGCCTCHASPADPLLACHPVVVRRCRHRRPIILSRRHPVEDSAARSPSSCQPFLTSWFGVLSDVASQLLGARRQQKQHGNSLLHLIGSWLFDCGGPVVVSTRLSAGPGRGRCGCLCAAFCQLPARLLHARLLGQVLRRHVQRTGAAAAAAAVEYSVYTHRGLLSAGLKGVPVYCQAILKAVHYILKANRDSPPVGQSRRRAYIPVASSGHMWLLVLDTLLLLSGLPLRADAAAVRSASCIAEDLASYENLVHSDEVLHGCRHSVQKLFTQAVAAICKRLNLEHDSALKMDYDTTSDCIGRVEPPGQTANRTGSISAGRTTRRTSLKSCGPPWLCDFINAASRARPGREHSRYLHSQIVATYDCLAQVSSSWACRGLQVSRVEPPRRGHQVSSRKWRKQKSPHSARAGPGGRVPAVANLMSQVGAFPPRWGARRTAYGSLLTEESFPDCRRRQTATPETLAPHQIPGPKWLANPGCCWSRSARSAPCHQPFVIVRGPSAPAARARCATRPDSSGPRPAPQSARPAATRSVSAALFVLTLEGARAPPLIFPAEPPGLPAVRRRRLRADAGFGDAKLAPRLLRLMAQRALPKRLPSPGERRSAVHRLAPKMRSLTGPRCTLCRGACAHDPDRLLAVSSAAAAASADFTSFAHGLGSGPANLPRPMSPTGRRRRGEVVFHRQTSGRPLEQSQPVLVWLETPRTAAPASTDALARRAIAECSWPAETACSRGVHGPATRKLQAAARWTSLAAASKGLVVPLQHRACLVLDRPSCEKKNLRSARAPHMAVRGPLATAKVQRRASQTSCEAVSATQSGQRQESRRSSAAVNSVRGYSLHAH